MPPLPPQFNKSFQSLFPGSGKPALTCVQVQDLPLDASIEIECIAQIKNGSNKKYSENKADGSSSKL